jgi:hypothetical protein
MPEWRAGLAIGQHDGRGDRMGRRADGASAPRLAPIGGVCALRRQIDTAESAPFTPPGRPVRVPSSEESGAPGAELGADGKARQLSTCHAAVVDEVTALLRSIRSMPLLG